MSKNVSLKVSGSDTRFNGVSRLRVPQPGGGTMDWLPADECGVGTIEIIANGVYKAADSNLYGFTSATVNVPQGSKAVGNGQDGKYYAVTVSGGALVYTEAPKSIQVATQPTKTTYLSRELLDYSGLVIAMYGGDGEIYTDDTYTDGTIPTSELIFPLDRATQDHIPVRWLCPQSGLLLGCDITITITEG